MKNIFLTALAGFTVFAGTCRAQPGAAMVPEMQSRVDSVSFYLGVAVGADLAESLPALDTELVALGLLSGYMSAGDLTDETTAFLDGFFAPFIYTDAVAEARAVIPTLPGTHPRYIARTADGPEEFPEIVLPDGIPFRVRANTGERIAVPELRTMPDSVFYYRGVMEGRFVSDALEEMAFTFFAKGFFAGYLADHKFDTDFIAAYLTDYFYGSPNRQDPFVEDLSAGYGGWNGAVTLPAGAEVPEMRNAADSAAFFVGVHTGISLPEMYYRMEPGLLLKGITAGLLHGDGIDRYEVHGFLDDYFSRRLPREQLRAAENFLDSLTAHNPAVTRSESGLMYEIIDRGDMSRRAISMNDTVEVMYTGTLADGTVFDASESPVSFTPGGVIRGFGEGLMYVGKGGRIKLYVHPSLAYGERASGPIPSNAVLVFDVTIVDAPQVED